MKRFIVMLCVLMGVLSLSAHEHYVIQHYSIQNGLSQNTVMAILQDKQGFMWFGTWDGLNRFDGYTFKIYKAMNNGQEARVNNRVVMIFEDEAEQIWWSTYDGHYYRIDASRKVTSEFPYDSLPEGMVARMAESDKKTKVDSRGIIWQADDTQGIMRYRYGQWKRFTPPLDSRYAGRLREHFFLLEDNLGRTWVNPTGGGWSYYDMEKDELVYPIERLTNMIHTAYIDRDGQMWISTYDGGVDCVNMDPTPYQLHDMRHSEDENGEVRAFARTKQGEVLTLVKSETGVYCALESSHGMLYGTKGQGLKNITTGKTIPTNHPDIYDLEEGRNGELYVATYGGGVNILRMTEKGWAEPKVVGQGMKVRDIEIVDETLWCGTTTGLLKINLNTYESTVIPSYDIRAIYYSRDKLWLGSFGGGLLMMDPKDPEAKITSVETFHDIILSMAGDGKNLWFTSESDIAQLDLETGNLYYYDALDGEHNTFFTEAEALRTPSGVILFGYSNGYCSFDPSHIRHSESVPPLRITRITAQDEEYEGDTITLPNGSNVTIEYAAMDYVGIDKIYYSYKMDGVDKSWNHPTDLRRVTYSNLQNGEYIFHVRSTNREGGDVENERTLVIMVDKPLWLTWWAILLYVIGILIVISITAYTVSTYNMLRQKVKIEQQVTDIKLRFFTNISHELRTPLTLIGGPVTQVLEEGGLTDTARKQLI